MNSVPRLLELTKQDAAIRDRNGVTPLQYASAIGSIESMRILIAAGADVNAADKGGSTPLVWAACDPARVSLLLEKGAAVNAKTNEGWTPLMAASACDSGVDSVKMMLAKGADMNAVSQMGQSAMLLAAFSGGPRTMRVLLAAGAKAETADGGGFTALMGAVGWGDLELVKMLLAKGANVNAKNHFAGKVVHGPIALRELTPLMTAAPFAAPELIKVLLDAGANVNAKDCRGMTPLMMAAASPQDNSRVVKMLLDKGADVNVVSGAGETALDWANKFGFKQTIAALEQAGAKGNAVPMAPVRESSPLEARTAAAKSVRLLQQGADSFFTKSNCVACHHQPMVALAIKAARQSGIPYDEKQAGMMKKSMVALLAPRPSAVLAMDIGPAGIDGLSNTTLALAAAGQEPAMLTDSAVAYLAARQMADGSWQESRGTARAPMFSSPITVTVSAMRAMQVYEIPARKAEFDTRIGRARGWLAAAKPANSDERAEVLMGLAWSGADKVSLRKMADLLVREQRADGGWAQLPTLESDAYATGLALRALREADMAGSHEKAYTKGVAYLLRTQQEDGSWYVRSRAMKLQPYFESGFRYGHEQWISYVATANAAVALLR